MDKDSYKKDMATLQATLDLINLRYIVLRLVKSRCGDLRETRQKGRQIYGQGF